MYIHSFSSPPADSTGCTHNYKVRNATSTLNTQGIVTGSAFAHHPTYTASGTIKTETKGIMALSHEQGCVRFFKQSNSASTPAAAGFAPQYSSQFHGSATSPGFPWVCGSAKVPNSCAAPDLKGVGPEVPVNINRAAKAEFVRCARLLDTERHSPPLNDDLSHASRVPLGLKGTVSAALKLKR